MGLDPPIISRLSGALNFSRRFHGMGIVMVKGIRKLVVFGYGDNVPIEIWSSKNEIWKNSERIFDGRISFAYCHNLIKRL